MTTEAVIRESLPSDAASLAALYPDAFPDEDLLPLLNDLLAEGSAILSLVACHDKALVGHVIFTTCRVSTALDTASLLGPLAVASAFQKQGIGTALIRAGLDRLKSKQVRQVFVLGDPAYYSRHGFEPESGIAPPYPLPEEWEGAWQSIYLNGDDCDHKGQLIVPQPWRKPDLWTP